jgi:hypothetical protein
MSRELSFYTGSSPPHGIEILTDNHSSIFKSNKMNNQYLGSAATLMSINLCFQICKAFNLPLWYVSMLTEPRERSKGDKNATNYRIGTNTKPLHDLMKSIYYADESTINDVYNYLSSAAIDLKAVAPRNNTKAGHYRMGYINYFNHKERDTYFTEFTKLLDKAEQVIYIEPDSGVAQQGKKISSARGDGYLQTNEIKAIQENLSENSIIIIRQMANNYLVTQEAMLTGIRDQLGTNALLVVDEVIQGGVYVLCRDDQRFKDITSRMEYYLSDYRFLKNSNRILLGIATADDINIRSIGNFTNAQ